MCLACPTPCSARTIYCDQGGQGDLGDKGDRSDKGDKGDRSDKGDRGDKGDKGDKGDGVVRLTREMYPPSDLECLSRQDFENIANC